MPYGVGGTYSISTTKKHGSLKFEWERHKEGGAKSTMMEVNK